MHFTDNLLGRDLKDTVWLNNLPSRPHTRVRRWKLTIMNIVCTTVVQRSAKTHVHRLTHQSYVVPVSSEIKLSHETIKFGVP